MEANNLFNNDQSGFRKNRSAIDHILRIQNDIINSIHRKKLTIGIFLDFKKAFDLLWKDGLLIKLKKKYEFKAKCTVGLKDYVQLD